MPKITVYTPSIRPQFLNITQECLENQTFQDFEWVVEIGLRNRGSSLCSDNNKMLRRAKGERIVWLQDCINILPNALEKIDALSNELWTFPVGQIDREGDVPEWDWRDTFEGELLGPHYWEADFASAPKQAFFDVGGYDETFDQGWGWDNVEVARRMYRTGRKAYCEPRIRGISLRHDKMVKHPFRFELPNNSGRAEESRARCDRGDYKLSYLQ